MSAIGKADLPGKGSVAGSTEYDPGAYELLKTIDDPAALRALDRRGLQRLAEELRTFILESVSQTGGHLSSNLGTVELTIALHHVFNTPHDRIVWDVGHQTYPHKILTGRREAMSRIRMSGGISGFPRRSESEYDTFGTAHSSTSVSAALGMAQGAKLKGEAGGKKRHVVAVIGDGAMSAGNGVETPQKPGLMDTALALSSITARASSIPPRASRRRAAGNPLTRKCSASGCATWRGSIHGLSESRPRCGRDPVWCASRRNSPTGISTSASRSSTRSPSPRVLPARA